MVAPDLSKMRWDFEEVDRENTGQYIKKNTHGLSRLKRGGRDL